MIETDQNIAFYIKFVCAAMRCFIFCPDSRFLFLFVRSFPILVTKHSPFFYFYLLGSNLFVPSSWWIGYCCHLWSERPVFYSLVGQVEQIRCNRFSIDSSAYAAGFSGCVVRVAFCLFLAHLSVT